MAVASENERTIAGLQGALRLLAEQPTPVGVSVKLESVLATDAPALHHVLRKGEAAFSWKVASIRRLEQVSQASICLDTVDVAVLPMLAAALDKHRAARLLQRCANDIYHFARKVDGKNGPYKLDAWKVRRVLVDANMDLVNKELPIDEERVAAIRQAMDTLKPKVVVLADDEPGSGGGGDISDATPRQRNVASLQECLLIYDEIPTTKKAVVHINSADLRQAPNLLQVLRKGEGMHGWKVPSMAKVNALAKISIGLDIVNNAILPMLEVDPVDPVAGRLLRRFGRDISRHAREIDGDQGAYHQAASIVSNMLVQANEDLKGGVAIGGENIAAVRHAMEGLRALPVVLPVDEAGGGGDGGEDL